MNRKVAKTLYTAPVVEVLEFPQALNLLVSVSIEAGFDDWEEGEEL